MTNRMHIRSAKHSDLPTLLRFEQGIVTAERPYDHTLKPDPISYYDIASMLDAPDCEVAVAELDGQLIGSGYAQRKASRHYLEPEFHAFIGFLYVDPDYRGKGSTRRFWIISSPGRVRMICLRFTSQFTPTTPLPFALMKKSGLIHTFLKCA